MSSPRPPLSLTDAVKAGDLNVVKSLLEQGADVNKKDKDGVTALIYASWDGYPEIVELLLKRGADPNEKDEVGDAALTFAVIWSHTEIVSLLLDKGANPHEKNNEGVTPLMYARNMKNPKIIEMLEKQMPSSTQDDRTKELQDNLKKKPMPQLRKKGGF